MIKVNVFSEEKAWSKRLKNQSLFFKKVCKSFPKKYQFLNKKVSISGWVKTFRANRFIALNDGSGLGNLQCVIDFENTDDEILKAISTGAAINVSGSLVSSQGSQQNVELKVDSCKILGDSNPETYPIQPKKHSFEFLRENAHLRTRTNTFGAVMRIRSNLSFAIDCNIPITISFPSVSILFC